MTSTDSATRVARNAAAIAAATILARGLQFGWSLLLAQLIGAAGYGIWGTLGAMLATAATLPEFGMGLIVLRDVSRQREAAGRYLAATLIAQLGLALAAYLILLVIGLFAPYDPMVKGLLALAGLSLFVDTLGNMGYNQLLAAERMTTTSALQIAHIVALVGLALIALLMGRGLPGLYIATIGAGGIRAAWHWTALRRAGVRLAWPPQAALIAYLFRQGWPIALSSFLAYAYQHVDKVLVFTFLGEQQAGYLTAAFVIVFGVIEVLSVAGLTALFPVMSRMAGENPTALRDFVDRLALLTFSITLPVGVGIAALARPLANVFFPGFAGTAAVLEVLIWHAVASMVGNVYAQLLLVDGRQSRLMQIRALGLAANIAGNVVLLPTFGLRGAGMAILIAQIAMWAAFVVARGPQRAEFMRLLGQMGRVGAAGAVMAAAIFTLREGSPVLAGVVGALIYPVGVLGLRVLGAPEWALVRRLAGAVPVVGRALVRLIPAG